ncbi:MAG: 4'-phosphopantetheinyl transferase superfamily protein [Alphaproteobacteria bacterium]|nr:4'-phosphopantetheinyl transferase superfamily protein [Alphaproteobacteria bacterium]
MERSWTIECAARPVLLFLHSEPPVSDTAHHASVSAAERKRAAAMNAPARAHTFLFARACLRRHLGHLLGITPEAVPVTLLENGKPVLPGGEAAFSLSHSTGPDGTRILIGIMRGAGYLGVDLQHMGPATDIEAIAKRFFSAEENAELAAVPPASRRRTGFDIWCKREARFKLGTNDARAAFADGALDDGFVYAVCAA